jgi:3-oxoacyl-[acyl-carrier protein] reductase
MGRSVAFRLAKDGASVVLNYGTHAAGEDAARRAEEVAAHVRRLGGKALIVAGDTRKEEVVQEMVAAAEREFGSVDILVINAGGEWRVAKLEATTLEHWRSVLEAELDAMFLALKYVLPGMRRRRWGRIVTLSMNGAMTRRTLADMGVDYTLGKTGRTWLSLALGHDEYENGITVNVIEPGPIEHMKLEEALAAAQGRTEDWAQRTKPVAHDAAELVAFLCSEAGRFISQSVIRYPTDHW